MVHAMMIGYSRETVRDRVRFSVSPISAVFLSISLLGRSVSLSFFFYFLFVHPFFVPLLRVCLRSSPRGPCRSRSNVADSVQSRPSFF